MNLTSPTVVQELLRRHGLWLQRGLGQNFLVDANILRKIVAAAALDPDSCVLEIGAGIGTLTRALAQNARQVVAVEIDRSLRPILKETLAGLANVKVEFGDVLQIDLPALLKPYGAMQWHVVANIPYQITSPLLGRLMEHKAHFCQMILMLQKEFAQRLLAEVGTKHYSAMTVFAQYHARIEWVASVSRHSFWPPPNVDSAVVRLTPLPQPPALVANESFLFEVIHAAFAMRRKTLLNALTAGLKRPRPQVEAALRAIGLDPSRRGETLSVHEFICLVNALEEKR